MTQPRRAHRGLKGKILKKSLEAYVLGLETINRLSVTYRVETFTYLLMNAWELLLKARILDETGSRQAIYYKDVASVRPRTLSVRDALKRVIPNEHDSTRRNVERVADLRDESVHLVLSQLPTDVMALLQACVLNYHRCLHDWFGIGLSDRLPVGMMTLVYDLSPELSSLKSPILRRRLGRDAADYLSQFETELRDEHAALGYPTEFSVRLSYSLFIEKRPAEADIRLSSGPDGKVTRVVEVAKDPSRTHPHRQKEVVTEVNRRLAGRRQITSYDVICICNVYGVKTRSEFHYRGSVPGNPDQYSDALVDWIADQYEHDAAFFGQTRDRYKSRSSR